MKNRIALGAILALAAGAQAGIITDPAIFGSEPQTLITFENDGAGAPVSLLQGQSLVMPVDAYAAQGVVFLNQVRWVNDGSAAFDAAQLLAGSAPNAIPSSFVNVFEFNFTVPVKSFGFFVINNRAAATAPVLTAYDSGGNVLETVTFGATFLDGSLTVAQTTADYGFMGLFTSTNIAKVRVEKAAAILDDLRFSPSMVPAPGAAAALGLAGLLGLRRRR